MRQPHPLHIIDSLSKRMQHAGVYAQMGNHRVCRFSCGAAHTRVGSPEADSAAAVGADRSQKGMSHPPVRRKWCARMQSSRGQLYTTGLHAPC